MTTIRYVVMFSVTTGRSSISSLGIMATADQSIAMMDGTYFVGRKEILDWINGVCETSLTKVEQSCNGAIACMILDAIYPGKVPMSKVDWSANKDYEHVQNYKILQKCFTTLKLDKFIEVDRWEISR